MDKKPIEDSCPFCQADAGRPCKNAEGRKLMGFHRHRYQTKKLPMRESHAVPESAVALKKIG
jgi:hypothetical protein